MENIYSVQIVMPRKILKTDFIWLIIVACMLLLGQAKAAVSDEKLVSFDLLNKLSAKKHRIEVPLGSAYVIQDMRIVPRSCEKIKDELYKVDSYVAHIEIFVEQDCGEYKNQPGVHQPILLYEGDLTNNTRLPSAPVEHPIYDLALVKCD